MPLVADVMQKVGGSPERSRTKLYDWLLWGFPWLNSHHRDTLTGEPINLHRPYYK